MTPVCPQPWHFTTFFDLLDHWQTLIAGLFALGAALFTVAGTVSSAKRQIEASREQADREIAANGEAADREIVASREQVAVAQQQIETTLRLERERDLREAEAFRAVLSAAMTRVIAEVDWVRKFYPRVLESSGGQSVAAYTARQSLTKGAFAELRAACLRRGSPLTAEFLDLEREIDNCALQWMERPSSTQQFVVKMGFQNGLREQLDPIVAKATQLRTEVARGDQAV